MSPVSALPERLKSGKAAIAAWCGLPHPASTGVLAREDFDAVVLDMQHGTIDFAAVIATIPLIVAAGKPAIARIPVGEFATASRILDAGASAIIAPMINSVEDAQRLAAFCKFPPVGERSWGPVGALAFTGLSLDEYLRKANDFTLAFAMIETKEAMAALDGILAVPGIDGVFVGPSDLSIALSDGAKIGAMGPEVDQAVDHVLARAKAAGKFATIYGNTPERSAELAQKGYDLVALVGDQFYLRSGAQAALKTARG